VAKGRELIARFKPGENLPVYATGANISAGRFVTISGKNAQGAYIGAHTGAGLYASGVSETDAIADKTDWRGGTNLTRRGSVARVVMGGAVTAGAAVKADANGKAIAQGGSGQILGYFIGLNATAGGNATAADQVGEIDLI
jgi:hypothetical protein